MNVENIHIKYSDLLIEYLDGTISQADKEKVEQWLESSPENIHFFNEMKNSWGNNLSINDIDENVALKNVHQKIKEKENTPVINATNRFQLKTFMRIAAMVVLFVGIGFIVFNYESPVVELASIEKVKNNNNLPDGSSIHLNVDSKITYPESFNKNTREITLEKGMIYCEVEHKDEEQEFIISTPETKVRVIGTSFQVQLSDNNDVNVIVEEGTVGFYKTDSIDVEVLLYKGDRGIYSHDKKQIEVIRNTDVNHLSWHTGILQFDQTLLKDVVKALNNHFNSNIKIKDEELNEEPLFGTFENKTEEEILYYIENIFNIYAVEENGETFLTFE